MKKLSLYIFLVLLMVSACSEQNRISECRGPNSSNWTDCFGTYAWSDGDKYVGEWKNGKQHGQGTYTWASGDKYVGEYKDGKEHGQGTYTWADGNKYVGEWKDEKFHGQGTFTLSDGTVYKGIWKKGELIERQD